MSESERMAGEEKKTMARVVNRNDGRCVDSSWEMPTPWFGEYILPGWWLVNRGDVLDVYVGGKVVKVLTVKGTISLPNPIRLPDSIRVPRP